MRKILALLLCAALVFSFAACGEKTGEEETTKDYILPTTVVDSDISLPYTSADVFDPYEAKSSLNRDLIPVMYEGLYYPTADGNGEMHLAADGEMNGLQITVRLKQNVKFSDGSGFTSKDVENSLAKARRSEYYGDYVSNISGMQVIDNYTVKFTLIKADAQAFNILSFPIVRVSGDNVLGTGAYRIRISEEDEMFLEASKYHDGYKSVKNKQISLYDMAGVSSPVYPFKANKISVYKNELSDGTYENLSSSTVSVPTYRFVYAGINSKWSGSMTSLEWVRQAINIGIDRAEITAGAFLGQGTAVVSPFKNEFYQLDGIELASTDGEAERAAAILERNGYDRINADGVRTNGVSNLNVSILVCGENQYKVDAAEALKKSLERLGFGVTVNVADTAESFRKVLEEGYFGLYIGETILTPNCDLSQFFTKKGVLNYGIDEAMFTSYATYRSEKGSLKPFIEEFSTNVPIVPLFYRSTVVSVNPNIKNINTSSGDLYAGVGEWTMSAN